MTKPYLKHSSKGQRTPQADKAAASSVSVASPYGKAPRKPEKSDFVGARISRRAADRLRAGHVWVYASDVEDLQIPNPAPALVPVADYRGILLGTALYSPTSQIAL